MKAIVIREKDTFRFMNTDNVHINLKSLSHRSRLNGGDIKYYEMNISEDDLKGMSPLVFIAALNKFPYLADKSDMLVEI